jgi:hypothetical protein
MSHIKLISSPADHRGVDEADELMWVLATALSHPQLGHGVRHLRCSDEREPFAIGRIRRRAWDDAARESDLS